MTRWHNMTGKSIDCIRRLTTWTSMNNVTNITVEGHLMSAKDAEVQTTLDTIIEVQNYKLWFSHQQREEALEIMKYLLKFQNSVIYGETHLQMIRERLVTRTFDCDNRTNSNYEALEKNLLADKGITYKW